MEINYIQYPRFLSVDIVIILNAIIITTTYHEKEEIIKRVEEGEDGLHG